MALHLVTGLVIGVGAGLLAPLIAPILKPLARSAVKAGVMAYDHAKVAFSELNERAGETISEVRAEIEKDERKALGGPPKSATGS